MDQDRVTRTTLPQVTVGIPLSLLQWIDEQAKAAKVSRSGWIVNRLSEVKGRYDDQPQGPARNRASGASMVERVLFESPSV